MPPTQTPTLLLSPAELSYLHTSLSLIPPIRPDARTVTQFRPLTAAKDILSGTNGSARVGFADGSEAVVGVKAEVERGGGTVEGEGRPDWVELTVEMPGLRDDDSMPVVLGSLLVEGIKADEEMLGRLRINERFHWRAYIDIILISPPLSYPLPLLSLTTHLALLSTLLPRLKSEGNEDPLFDDDWAAAVPLYPQRSAHSTASSSSSKPASSPLSTRAPPRPPIALLVIAVGPNILFDPSASELAVAEIVLSISVAEIPQPSSSDSDTSDLEAMDVDSAPRITSKSHPKRRTKSSSRPLRNIKLLSVRTIDPPARLTPPGIPNFLNSATNPDLHQPTNTTSTAGRGAVSLTERERLALEAVEGLEGVWKPLVGGAKRKMVAAMVAKVLEGGGVVDEVLEGLKGVV